ncbi:MAG TPA: RagB/SusD family nutrient uptake outer membrane protein [Fodinibius sp.]|nr:RagB/SusD family nutrient uptake outer membrane protein [Fodinibius sp.]
MKYALNITVLALFFIAMGGCDDFLTQPPKDTMTDETYWTNENNVRSFAWGFYTGYFQGYGSGFAWGDYFSGQSLNDDFAPTTPPDFIQNVPTSGGGWTFSWVRKANVFIDRVKEVPMEQEAIEHWTGIGRFFRALEYNDLVKRFGDVPWYGELLEEGEEEKLYKKRDPRTTVLDSVLADFQYAVENVREDDGADKLTVNKYVVLSFMSRIFLYHGTYLKYHEIDQDKAREYLQVAKEAAAQVMRSGRYSIANDYRGLFNSMDLSGNPGIILYRKYEEGVLTHSLNSYSNKEPQTGPSKDAIEAYLADDGLPITISPKYQGDKSIEDVMANRDPRITETFVQELRLNGQASNYSTSGYAQHKFLNEDIADLPIGVSNDNPTDGPVIRYGEVLMNYAEAAAELATLGGPTLTQEDLNKSINVLRNRPGIDMPALQVMGNQPAVNGQTYDDPERDPSVSPIIWEIRRERRVELMMEGFRLDDLKRWKKLEYVDTIENKDINRGAWVDLSGYPESVAKNIHVENEAEEGYIVPAYKDASQRTFDDPRVYLRPIPLDQITLYKENGVDLEQNPGW